VRAIAVTSVFPLSSTLRRGLIMICVICIIARWLALLLASANNPVTSDVQAIWTHANQPHLVRRQPTRDVSWASDATGCRELWLAVSKIAPRSVVSMKIHSVIVKPIVQMSLTLKQLNEITTFFSTVNLEGRLQRCAGVPRRCLYRLSMLDRWIVNFTSLPACSAVGYSATIN